MATPLLTTKLYIPPPRPDLVPRPRLIERLDEGLRPWRKLTLVSAPAGFGKYRIEVQGTICPARHSDQTLGLEPDAAATRIVL